MKATRRDFLHFAAAAVAIAANARAAWGQGFACAPPRRIVDLGDSPLSLSSSEFTKLVADETEKWRKVIAAGNIRAE
jgi:hypothetical protein